MEKFNQNRKVEIKIPDSDVSGWMEQFREFGMSAEEIDEIMQRLNKTYWDYKNPVKAKIEEEVKFRVQNLRDKGESIDVVKAMAIIDEVTEEYGEKNK